MRIAPASTWARIAWLFHDGANTREIAMRLQLSEAAVYNALDRARRYGKREMP